MAVGQNLRYSFSGMKTPAFVVLFKGFTGEPYTVFEVRSPSHPVCLLDWSHGVCRQEMITFINCPLCKGVRT